MDGDSFSPEQQEFLKGFMAGVEARRGSLSPAGGEAGGAPPDAMRAAQDAAIARGGKLTPEERAKRDRHPLDRWDEVVARARAGKFPTGVDNLLTRWHGLFYVGPTQESFMCRLRIPGGTLTAHHLRGIAAIAEECAEGHADATNRCNLQIRGIPAARGPEVIERLGEIGILPKGTGADNIRNISATPTAGIDPHEIVDVRPMVRALHVHILHTRDLYGLPRKFNISFDGGGRIPVLEDTADVAFTAVRVEGEALFRLGLGGITGHRDFARDTGVVLPPEDAVRVSDAILRVFLAHGDRTDRRKARLKYLLDSWGFERFLGEVEKLLGAPLRRAANLVDFSGQLPHGHLGVHDQRQEGLQYIGLRLPMARMTAAQMRGIASLSERHGSASLRLTPWQNILLIDIPRAEMGAVQDGLAALGLGWEASHVAGGLVACTGAAGCKFAASHTKQHGEELVRFLDARIVVSRPVNIHLTGCHNSCAQHYIGDIGLIGAKVERGEEEVEGYDLHLGGGAGAHQRIGRLVRAKVAHDELGPLVLNLLRAWQAAAPELSLHDFTLAHDVAALDALLGEARAEVPA